MRLFDTLLVGGSGFIGSHIDVPARIIDPKINGGFVCSKQYDRYRTIIWLAMTSDPIEDISDLVELQLHLNNNPKTHIIFASSAAVYGECIEKAKETDILSPINSYGLSKIYGEDVAKSVKNHTILRFSNVYGEGGHGVIDLFKKGKRTIYGDGTSVRDFIEVEKVVKVIEEAKKNPQKFRGTFNVSSGVGNTINQVFEINGKGKAVYKPAKDEIRKSILDNSKIKKAMKW